MPSDDLPTSGSTTGGVYLDLLEAIGLGDQGPLSETVVTGSPVHLCGQDVHSPQSANARAVLPNLDGSPSLSYERWVRVRFSPPFGEVSNFRFWIDPITIPTGWTILWGYTSTYTSPSSGRSLIAVNDLPQIDPVSSNIASTAVMTGEAVRYSPYIVLQGSYIPDETSPSDLLEPNPGITFNFSYDQS